MMSQLEEKEEEGKEKQIKKNYRPSPLPFHPFHPQTRQRPEGAGKVGNFRNLEQNHHLSP